MANGERTPDEDVPTPPAGISWGGSLLPEQHARGTGTDDETATGPLSAGSLRAAEAAAAGEIGAEPEPEGAPGPSDRPVEPRHEGGTGLAELVATEDFGRGGPAVLGGETQDPGESYGAAGDWPTLQRRERRNERESRSGGAFGWIKRRRGGQE